ncbi:coenzyme F420-reducing hydrogenase beta subunit [Ruminiclostridium sufflavum DSM 19573]|uniref:Coenzyme F420-reducing hydrogenase beta subunit n=1 Tax=Ruminiclostridium sufflavum DSM 19573 TaxID=1121337 RepID=A0A318XQ64_9FIRM|nr:polysaccharide pyruvyl transferase family protein [Ruminiclostridium sufflavum]PYG89470.1 coenzyme F420-reducing hydrogenase beta subunit [Ruminiclostridium sufflavum DSM 19573]
MNKIAVMTWYHYNNFGTVLQVYALNEILKELGHTPGVINYIPDDKRIWTISNIFEEPLLFTNKLLTKIKRSLKVYGTDDNKRDEAFECFRKEHIAMTSSCKTASELYALNRQFDVFICGSDQIWSPDTFNPKYFLDFVSNTSGRIAYAPSMGVAAIENNDVMEHMKKEIQRFKHLSVREGEGSSLIQKLTGQEARVVLDPTLLRDKSMWDRLVSSKEYLNILKRPYLLCYFLGRCERYWHSVSRIAKLLDLEAVVIPVHPNDYKRGFEVIKGAGPKEFLELFSGAEFVCTDSYHGTIFSIINEKPFVVYKRFSDKSKKSQNSRIYSLLRLLGLEGLLYSGNDRESAAGAKDIDYKNVKIIIEEKRKESIKFLKDSIADSLKARTSSEFKITNTCCGCGACEAACPQAAVSMELDGLGFLKAKVDKDSCIKCRVCISVCPFNGKSVPQIGKEGDKLFMGRSKSAEVLNKSSSGGVAHEIASFCCENGYAVTGCIYDNDKRLARHMRIAAGALSGLKALQGSKYLQSHFGQSIKDTIASEKAAVFGTPCQIAGLANLLSSKGIRDNYVLVDLICHGVPSDILWKRYLEELNLRSGRGTLHKADFRYKPMGWQKRYIRIESGEKVYTEKDTKDLFYRFYKAGNCLAESCYECNYRTSGCADIRLGDYWGEKYKREKTGASMVLALTQKGEKLLESLYNAKAVALEENSITDYWEIQHPQNEKKPLFYYRMLSDMKSGNNSLKALADEYCRQYEQARLIYKAAGRCGKIAERLTKVKYFNLKNRRENTNEQRKKND